MTAPNTVDWTILIADDEPGIRDLMTAWLEPQYDLRVAGDGKEALALVDEDVDMALLDRRMPGLSGDEVLDMLRESGHDFPVAMITAVTPDVDIVDMPFDDYIVKPIAKDELVRTVDLLRKRADYDEQSREFFRLASKRGRLRASENVDHHTNEEYKRITEEIEDLREELDDVLTDIAEADLQRAFQSI